MARIMKKPPSAAFHGDLPGMCENVYNTSKGYIPLNTQFHLFCKCTDVPG